MIFIQNTSFGPWSFDRYRQTLFFPGRAHDHLSQERMGPNIQSRSRHTVPRQILYEFNQS